MLEHSRGSSAERRMVDLNALIDEALNLAYHGARAQDQSFNITLERDFGEGIAPIEVNPQDMTRVFLNIFSNGFYAATRRARNGGDAGFVPTLKVTTRDAGDAVEIRVRDNGIGIPAEIRDKLFQPFFTTKPTGEGTGLGLSITYDIVTQQHGGRIRSRARSAITASSRYGCRAIRNPCSSRDRTGAQSGGAAGSAIADMGATAGFRPPYGASAFAPAEMVGRLRRRPAVVYGGSRCHTGPSCPATSAQTHRRLTFAASNRYRSSITRSPRLRASPRPSPSSEQVGRQMTAAATTIRHPIFASPIVICDAHARSTSSIITLTPSGAVMVISEEKARLRYSTCQPSGSRIAPRVRWSAKFPHG